MLTEVQIQKFSAALSKVLFPLQQHPFHSDAELFRALQKLPRANRTGIWRKLGIELIATPNEVHDYYFNTWQIQFYQNANESREDLKKLFLDLVQFCENPNEAINRTIQVYMENQHNCNKRQLYQILYRYAVVKPNKDIARKYKQWEQKVAQLGFEDVMQPYIE
ncbi:Conserved_hypothetical protein [Hexamita inflata]|uniref:Uncharacterized protein n=1 Tax=Hexamita inflata TaxID=28002 RepID=A0ABP1H614_9EUKA